MERMDRTRRKGCKEMNTERRIKAYLEANGITQSSLSRRTGISTDKLCLLLNGKRKLTVGEYELICRALCVRVGEFLEPRAPDRQ